MRHSAEEVDESFRTQVDLDTHTVDVGFCICNGFRNNHVFGSFQEDYKRALREDGASVRIASGAVFAFA
jgi:hypothetical protein